MAANNSPATEPIHYYQDDTFLLNYAVVECIDGVKTPRNLTGASIEMVVNNAKTGTEIVKMSTVNSRITFPSGAASGAAIIRLNPVNAGGLIPGVELCYRIRVTESDGLTYTTHRGPFTVTNDEVL